MKSLLIIEDDRKLNTALTSYFQQKNYRVTGVGTLTEVESALNIEKYDLVISDLSLPDGDGLIIPQLIRRLSLTTPILFLTGRDEDQDIITGYDAGAVDYIVKPIHPDVLLKKVEVALKHQEIAADSLRTYRDLDFHMETRQLTKNGRKIYLTAKELKLLELFFANIGTVLTKETILEKVWDIDGDFVGENTVSVTVNRLRKKLQADNPSAYIQNIFGLGYIFGE